MIWLSSSRGDPVNKKEPMAGGEISRLMHGIQCFLVRWNGRLKSSCFMDLTTCIRGTDDVY